MKKLFSFVLVAVVLATVLGINVGSASAAGSKVVVYIPGVTQQQVKDATVFVDSDFYPAHCVLKDAETGKVVCTVPGKFGGEGAVLHVAGRVITVSIPEVKVPKVEVDEPITCAAGETLGADVSLQYAAGHWYGPFFVGGDTLAEVETAAQGWLGVKFVDYEIHGGLYCSVEK